MSWLFFLLSIFCGLQLDCKASVFEEGNIPVAGDASLYYQTIGRGSPLIFLHGGPGLDSSYLLPQLGKFQDNYQVIFYDQRGSGFSKPETLDWSLMNMAQFVEDLEIVRKTVARQKIIVAGHSWGGLLAMAYAIAYPQQVTALILLDSMPATGKGYNALDRSFTKCFAPIQDQLKALEESPSFIKGDTKLFNKYQRLQSLQLMKRKKAIENLTLNFSTTTAKNALKIDDFFTQHLFKTPFTFLPNLRTLQMPTLLIYGKEDPIPLWTAREIAAAIPHAHLTIIKDCGHNCFVEQEEKVLSRMNSFLTSLTKK